MPMEAEICSRPRVGIAHVPELLYQHYGMKTLSTKEFKSHEDRNFYVTCDTTHNGEEYVLKIMSVNDESKGKKKVLLNYISFSKALQNAGFVCSVPVPGLDLELIQHHSMNDPECGAQQDLVMCLLLYIPGTVLYDMVPLSHSMLFELGSALSQMQIATKELSIPELEEKQADNEWALENLVQLEKYLVHFNCEKKSDQMRDIIKDFKTHLLPHIDHLEKGIIHGDFHDENIVFIDQGIPGDEFRKKYHHDNPILCATSASSPKVKYGILDMGDVCYSAYLFDLATSLAFFMMSASVENFISHVGHFIAGYSQQKALNTIERDLLYYAVCGAYCRELILCEYHYKLQNGSNEYLLTSSRTGWDQLEKMYTLGKTFVDGEWDMIVALYK